MKSISTARMKELDRLAIEKFGIPSVILMENAGRGIADLAEKMLRRRRAYILVVCGKGNNGGDGLVAARHLANRGYRIKVVLLARPNELKDDPKTNFEIVRRMRIPIEVVTPGTKKGTGRNYCLPPFFKSLIRKSDLIIDAIFGVGLTRPIEGICYEVISTINESKKPVLSVDVPSGLNSDTGEELGIAIRACATGTLGRAKRGLYFGAGPKVSGKVFVLDISIPRHLF